MINWVKNILGITPKRDEVFLLEPEAQVVEKPTPAKKPTAKKVTKYNKASLGKMTKAQIDELAKSELKIDLDSRKTKDVMIAEFLKAQKK